MQLVDEDGIHLHEAEGRVLLCVADRLRRADMAAVRERRQLVSRRARGESDGRRYYFYTGAPDPYNNGACAASATSYEASDSYFTGPWAPLSTPLIVQTLPSTASHGRV